MFFWVLYHKSVDCRQTPTIDHFLAQKYLFKVSDGHIYYVFDVFNANGLNKSDYCRKSFQFLPQFLRKFPFSTQIYLFNASNEYFHYISAVVDIKMHNLSAFRKK